MIDKRSWRRMNAYRSIRLWGGVSGAKGDSTAKDAEKQSAAFQTQLMNMFKEQFGEQSNILKFLTGKMTNAINNPQGFTDQALTAARTQATEGTARDFNQAQVAAKEFEAQQGGNGLPSGVQAQITGQNTNAAAQEQATAQNQIELANAQQQQQNYWNAVGMLSGTAQLFNPQSYAGASTSAGNSVADLSKAYSTSQQTGFFNTLANGFGNSLGSGLGSALSGGLPGIKALGH